MMPRARLCATFVFTMQRLDLEATSFIHILRLVIDGPDGSAHSDIKIPRTNIRYPNGSIPYPGKESNHGSHAYVQIAA